MTMLVSGTARQLRQMPSTRSSSAEHAVGDRTLVAHLAEHELDLADPAPAALAADPVPQPGPAQRAQQGLLLGGGDVHAVGQDRHVVLGGIRSRSATVHLDSSRAVELGGHAVARRAAAREAVSPPVSTIVPASRRSPRAASALASQATAAAGWPIAAPPAAVSNPPRYRNTQPSTWRSTSSPGVGGATRARPARRPRCRRPSRVAGTAGRSGSPSPRSRGSPRRSPPARPASGGAGSIRRPMRNAISGSARGWMSSASAPVRRTARPCPRSAGRRPAR